MKCLFLDLASHNGLLSCITKDAVIASAPVDHRLGDHELIPVVETLLKDAGWTYQDLTGIACVVGPGGFTSLRVAVAFANTLAWSLKIPSAGVHLSDLYAARFILAGGRLQSAATEGNCLWLHSTKKTELFARGFGSCAQIFPEAVCVSLDDFRSMVGALHAMPLRWTGELIPEHQQIVEDLHMQMMEIEPIEKILPRFLRTPSFKNQTLLPWYGRGW